MKKTQAPRTPFKRKYKKVDEGTKDPNTFSDTRIAFLFSNKAGDLVFPESPPHFVLAGPTAAEVFSFPVSEGHSGKVIVIFRQRG